MLCASFVSFLAVPWCCRDKKDIVECYDFNGATCTLIFKQPHSGIMFLIMMKSFLKFAQNDRRYLF